MAGAGIQHKPVGVFWDIENCSVPKSKVPSDVIAHIRNFFVCNRLNHREYEFIIACDVTKLRKDMPDDINKAGGVTLAHVNGSSKNAADEKLRETMKKFVDTHASASSASPVLILISGDIDFVNDLRGYQTRLGCTIVVVHAPNCSAQFKVGWNEIYCFASFCSAVKDNPAVDAAAQSKNPAKKQQKNQAAPPPSKPNQIGQQNQSRQRGNSAHRNPGGQGNPKNQGEPSGGRNKHNGQMPYRQAQPLNMAELQQQQTGQFNQNQRGPIQTNGVHHFHYPPPLMPMLQQQGPQFERMQQYPEPLMSQQLRPEFDRMHQQQPNPPQLMPQQQQGPQFSKRHGNKPFNRGGDAGNVNQLNTQHPQQQPKGNRGYNPAFVPASVPAKMPAKDAADKPPATNKLILMVGGLPGKMDFKILKDNLQFQANKVHGKVKYVKNGRAFITFNHKANADRAVELFNGKQVFGKTLNVSFTKTIPFEDQPNVKPKPGSDGFVMVEQHFSTGRSKKPINEVGKSNGSTVSNEAFSNGSVLDELGSIIGGIVDDRIAAAKPHDKSPDACVIQ